MGSQQERTIWFAKDTLVGVAISVPLWGIGGLFWGLLMALFLGGPLVGWLFAGLLWGAASWVIWSILLIIGCREIATTIPLQDQAAFPQRLGDAAKAIKYLVEQSSPRSYVCRPRYGLARLLALEFTKLHVILGDQQADLIGPSYLVKKVRKKLLSLG